MNLFVAPMLAQNDLPIQDDIPMPESSVVHQGSYWFPEQASTFARDYDFLYMAILWISTVFFVLIIGFMVYFMIKYRRREGVDPEPSSSHNTALEIFWSVIPSIILVWIFYAGAKGYFEMRVPLDDSEEIYVTANQFNWKFVYPDGDVSKELHIVVNRPVKLIMQSDDVLHGLFIPAFRQKMDIVPGRYTYAYLAPNKVGAYRLACAEYCGTGHSRMRTVCTVHKDEADRKNTTKWENEKHVGWVNGRRLFQINCSGCHGIDGSVKTGPALNTIWGTDERLSDGTTVKVDENYVRESILEPSKTLVENYGTTGTVSKMPSFQGKLNDKEIGYLIDYIRYLKDPAKFPAEDTVVEPEPADGASPADPAKATDDKATDDKATDGKAADDPTTKQPTTKQPTTKQPTPKQPTTKRPTTKRRTTKRRTTKRRTTKRPTTKRPTINPTRNPKTKTIN